MTPTNPPQYSISEVLDTLLGEWGASPAFETDQIKKAEQAINQLIYTQVLELIMAEPMWEESTLIDAESLIEALKAKYTSYPVI